MLGGVGARQFPGGRLKSHLLAARRIFTTRRHLSVLPRPTHSMTYIDRSGSTAPRRGGLRRAGCGTFHVRRLRSASVPKSELRAAEKLHQRTACSSSKCSDCCANLWISSQINVLKRSCVARGSVLFIHFHGFLHQFIFVSAGYSKLKATVSFVHTLDV